MKISFDWIGTYLEHKDYFDAMATALQLQGHEVGIITGERENRRVEISNSLGFVPNFIKLWGENETIANGNLWKSITLKEMEINVHYDDDATELKKYTDGWIIKTLNSNERKKF